MSLHLQRNIDQLKKRLLALGAVTEESVRNAVFAIADRDTALVNTVFASAPVIDHMEVELEEEGLKLLALHQPFAHDLRLIVAVLKINADLERIGDLAVNIAKLAEFLNGREPIEMPFNFRVMATRVQWMLKASLDALVNEDLELARRVLKADDEVDAIHRQAYAAIEERVRQDPDSVNCVLRMLSSSRHLERIADHATNIAEDVIYFLSGDIVRHRGDALSRMH